MSGEGSTSTALKHLQHKIDLEVVERTGKGVEVIKQRWKMERTLAWVLNDRRHRRDYEVLTVNSEAMIQISMIPILLTVWCENFKTASQGEAALTKF